MSHSRNNLGHHSSTGICRDNPVRIGANDLQKYIYLYLSFLAVNVCVVYGYCILYQRVEEEEYGGTWELLKEGFMTSFALFLVSQSVIN